MNILVHQNTIKLADFGLSRRLQRSTCYTENANGIIPYMDPIIFKPLIEKREDRHTFKLTKKSDIYSLGVLYWELTKCVFPFNFRERASSYYSHFVDIK